MDWFSYNSYALFLFFSFSRSIHNQQFLLWFRRLSLARGGSSSTGSGSWTGILPPHSPQNFELSVTWAPQDGQDVFGSSPAKAVALILAIATLCSSILVKASLIAVQCSLNSSGISSPASNLAHRISPDFCGYRWFTAFFIDLRVQALDFEAASAFSPRVSVIRFFSFSAADLTISPSLFKVPWYLPPDT